MPSTMTESFTALPSKYDPDIAKQRITASLRYNVLRDQFPLTMWLSVGAVGQLILLLTLRRYQAMLPLMVYLVYSSGSLLNAAVFPSEDPYVTYGRTTALVPATSGETRSGLSGEKIAVLHLAFKNYSPLGLAAPGWKEHEKFAPEMFRELDSPEGRAEYGFLGLDYYLQASSPVSTTSSMVMAVIYFRSLEGVHSYARSELHRKVLQWYNNFEKKMHPSKNHFGVMHEVFEAPAGQWECIQRNIEKVGLARASARLDNGDMLSTHTDARKGVLASAKGRIS